MKAIAPPVILTTRWQRISVVVVTMGVVFLLIQYLWQQSYWGDEVSVLNNIVHKSFAQLFTEGLDHSQAAPPIFLAAQKFMWLSFGSGEYSERLIPVLMAIGALTAFAGLTRRVLPPGTATFALTVLCLSDKFIWHATEVKQYSGDVLCSILLIWLALDAKNSARFLWLSIAAAAMVWMSHPVVFIYAAIALSSSPSLYIKAESAGEGSSPPPDYLRGWIFFIAGNALVLLSFAALYWFSIRHQRNDSYLQDFWRDAFVDWSHPTAIPIWLAKQLWSVCDYVVTPISVAGVILCAMMILGAVSWVKNRRWQLLGLCLGPLALVILAAAAGEYPLSGARVDFFLVPGLLLTAGEGLNALTKILPSHRTWIAGIAAIILLPLLVLDIRALFLPRVRMNLRPVVAQLKLHRQPHEPILTTQEDILRWYWPDAPGIVSDNLALAMPDGQRFWYVVAGKPENLVRDEQPDLQQIGKTAKEITAQRIEVRGGAAFCFQARPSTTDSGR